MNQVQSRQRGMILLISLVMLLIVTMVGVWTMRGSLLEERMARNVQDNLLALQATEAALVEAETYLDGVVTLGGFSDTGAAGLWTESAAGDPERWVGINWSAAEEPLTYVIASPGISGLAEQPKYMIEVMTQVISESNTLNLNNLGGQASASDIRVFKITARGVGGTSNTAVMLQSTYGRDI